ncbi:MAG: hypothetical protein H7X80_02195 [bacterium]|nr:hypothetical protein [Candidatus Kapabacteria bacterium]
MQLGIACESGGFRCVFVHGVLDALEQHEIRAAVYAAASASVLPAALAAVGHARAPGLAYWYDAHDVRMREGNGMSEMVLAGIAKYSPLAEARLFEPGASRLIVTASEVVDSVASEQTQGALASRAGREQLLKMARGDDSWAADSLRPVAFDSHCNVDDPSRDERIEVLTRDNFREVAYASTRMLHAWRVPATIGDRPFIDASYTDGFPVRSLARFELHSVLAIATGIGEPYSNLYRRENIARVMGGVNVELIAPHVELKELGVDFTTATREGLAAAYQHGRDVADGWVAAHRGAR